jgi:hypothetical protein
VWETPLIGPRYVVALLNGAMAVWRTAGFDARTLQERPARLVAACVDETGINKDRLVEWAHLAAIYYGLVQIVVDTNSLPGAVERLREMGSSVAARQQPVSERRVGQATAIRKPGHEYGKEEQAQGMAMLQQMWRDGNAEIWCPTVLRQMGGLTCTDQGGFEVLQGFSTHWIDVCAFAILNLGQASQGIQPGSRFDSLPGYDEPDEGEKQGLPRRPRGNRLY